MTNRRPTLMWTTRTLLLAVGLVVSIAPAFAQDSGAKVIVQQGQVSLANGGLFKTLSVGDRVNARQLIITGPDGYARLEVLSDGSTFEVFPNSRVVFRETPGNWEHLLNVFFGRVKVFIQHAPGVPNPNNVTSPTAVISVRGTVFDVQVQDSDGTTVVSVDEGEVAVRNMTAPGNAAILHAGDSITVYFGQRLIAAGVNRGGAIQRLLEIVRNRILTEPLPTGGSRGPIPTGVPGGAQGDKGGSNGGNAPGAPPNAPGAPPAGPGGN